MLFFPNHPYLQCPSHCRTQHFSHQPQCNLLRIKDKWTHFMKCLIPVIYSKHQLLFISSYNETIFQIGTLSSSCEILKRLRINKCVYIPWNKSNVHPAGSLPAYWSNILIQAAVNDSCHIVCILYITGGQHRLIICFAYPFHFYLPLFLVCFHFSAGSRLLEAMAGDFSQLLWAKSGCGLWKATFKVNLAKIKTASNDKKHYAALKYTKSIIVFQKYFCTIIVLRVRKSGKKTEHCFVFLVPHNYINLSVKFQTTQCSFLQ